MKKVLLVLLCIVFSASVLLAGCGESDNGGESGISNVSEKSEESSKIVEPGETYEFGGTSIVLPKGFTVNEKASPILATPEDYPVHADNIAMTNEKHSKIADIEEEALLALIRETDDDIAESVTKFDEFAKSNVDGHDVLTVRYSFTYSGLNMKAIQYSVDTANGIVTYTFTSVTGEYDADFEMSLGSVKVNG